MTIKTIERVISTQCYKADQSWVFDRIVVVGLASDTTSDGVRLRVHIVRNAYDFQSYARVSRWDGAQWHEVTSEPIEACECKRVSYVDRTVTAAAFETDCKRLIQTAIAVTGGK